MPGSRDDPSILDPDPPWRRVHPDWIVPGSDGADRLSSAAFENSPDGTGTSVTLGREARAAGVTPVRALARFPGYRLVSVTAGACRAVEQAIARDPTEEDPHHALVEGRKTKSTRRELARAAAFLEA